MYIMFELYDIDVVFFIDVFNVFNVFNRVVVLYNIWILCFIIVIYVINIYRQLVWLFVIGGKEIVLVEGIIQGDLFVMGLYILSIQFLIMSL